MNVSSTSISTTKAEITISFSKSILTKFYLANQLFCSGEDYSLPPTCLTNNFEPSCLLNVRSASHDVSGLSLQTPLTYVLMNAHPLKPY